MFKCLGQKPFTEPEVRSQISFERRATEKIVEAKAQQTTELSLNYVATDAQARHMRNATTPEASKKRLILPKSIFTSDPQEFFSRLTKLTLEQNGLTKIPAGSFDLLTALKEISLKFNKLKALPENLFKNLSALEVIDLGFNNLKTLSKKQFASQKLSLTSLNLEHQQSGNWRLSRFSIPAETLKPLGKLIEISLDGNPNLQISQKVFSSFVLLQKLNLRNIKNLGDILKKNPEFLLQFVHLKEIKISGNQLTEFPQLPPSTKYVDAMSCGLSEFSPENVANNPALTYLNISSNLLKAPSKQEMPHTLTTYITDDTVIDNAFSSASASVSHA